MSGHSKWDKIHRQKGAADQKRGKIFTVLVKNIIVAAKDGNDPDMNFKLRMAIDKAKAANMPSDNIARAIAKGSGGGEGAQMDEVMYEGYGPNGVAFLIEAVTDNRNRTTAEIKNILTKAGGTLASQNAVQWMFDHKGVVRVNESQYDDMETFQLELIDLGADDVIAEEGGLTVYCSFETYPKLTKALADKGIEVEHSEMEWLAKDEVEVDEKTKERIEKFFDLLEDNDDAGNYYSNASI